MEILDAFIFKVIVGSIVALIMVGVAIIGLSGLFRPKVLLRQRMAAIGVIEGPKKKDSAVSEKAESRRQKRIQEKVKQLKTKGDRKGIVASTKLLLLQSGVEAPVEGYFIACLIFGFLATFLYMASGMPLWGAIPAFFVGSLFLPKFVLGYLAKQRQKRFTQQFADAIDVVVRGLRSGLPVSECFNIIGREFPDPVSTEFRLMIEGQNLGMAIEDVMAKGLERVPTPEYKFFAIVIQIQKQTGGNLADTLSGLSNVIRERKKLKDKVQALSSEAKSSAMIIGSLPFVVASILSLINPGYIMILIDETAGNIMIGVGLAWMGLGTFIMAQMINFDA